MIMTEKTIEQKRAAWQCYAWLEAHPKHHNQAYWAYAASGGNALTLARLESECGTTACFAGAFQLLQGHRVQNWTGRVLDRGRRIGAAGWTQQDLGLTDEEAEWLFLGTADLEDVQKALTEIFGPREAVL
jgi:hypothetical protein